MKRPSRLIGSAVGASSLVLGVLVTAGLTGAASARPSPGAQRASNPIRFSHMVIVDEQRPGNEPDIKVNGYNNYFTSIPFGFSTTESFVWRSMDHGASYQFVPGTIGEGKPETCAGGGDTDLFFDRGNVMYFSDLQGLTNISNSVSKDGGKTFTTTCAGAGANTPVDRMWFTGTGTIRNGGTLHLYQDFDQVGTSADPSNSGGNQLVETYSTDGTNFVPVVNPNVGPSNCAGTAPNCVTDNEGISGNQVIDPKTGNLFIAHTTINGNSQGGTPGVSVSEGKVDLSGATPSATWHESRNLDGGLCPGTKQTCVDSNGNPTELAGENFASIARDRAGYLWVTFTAGPIDHANSNDPNFGQLTRPEQIYVVHSLEPATMADPSQVTWSRPIRITGPKRGISGGTNTFPWITAGSKGRVAVAYYHTAERSQAGTCGVAACYGASQLSKAEWTVQVAETLNGTAAMPSWQRATVSEGPIKYGEIRTSGLGCTTGGDRSLGDFLQITPDRQGALLVSYVNDTSGNVQGGEDAGPEVVSRQISGPSLLAGHKVTRAGGPGLQMNSIKDRTRDAFYSANGSRTSAIGQGAPRFDIRSASITQPANSKYLVGTIHTGNLVNTRGNAALGGRNGSWLIRWEELRRGTPGNGLIYYVLLDGNNGAPGSKPTFYMGTTSCIPPNNPQEHCKFLTYPETTPITGKVLHKKNQIEFFIPRKALHEKSGGRLISVTAFDATSTGATAQSATTIFNLIDATPPFDVVLR